MSAKEKEGATLLGYTELSWDNESGNEPQPAASDKYWADLTSCGDVDPKPLHPIHL